VSEEERVRPGGRPRRREREAKGERVTAPLPPTNPDLPVHKQAAERVKRSYTWEPFSRSNYLSVKSGVGSERIVSGLAERLADWIVAEHPDLGGSRYRPAVAAWARAESLVALITRRLDEIGVFDEKGEARGMLNALRTAERRASEERSKLGLSPADHAVLEQRRTEAVRSAADLSGLVARGREAIEARGRDGEDER
jgi:hypothetical protein